MLRALRNRVISAGWSARSWSVRAARVLLSIGRPRVRTLDHVTLAVHDLDLARRFYCGVLGGAHVLTIDDAALRRFGRPPAPNGGDGVHHVSVTLGGDTRVDLFLQSEGQPSPTRGHPHYAFLVPPGDMRKWKKRLEEKGIPTEGPLQLGFPGQASLYFNDPSGNHLELTCIGYTEEIPVRPPDVSRLVWDPATIPV